MPTGSRRWLMWTDFHWSLMSRKHQACYVNVRHVQSDREFLSLLKTRYTREQGLKCSVLFILNFFNVFFFGVREIIFLGENVLEVWLF